MNREYLAQCLSYDRDSGEFTWLHRPREHFNTDRGYNTFVSQRVGKKTGCVSFAACGLAYVKIAINKKLYFAHRLAWIIENGEIPCGYEIDHIDHDGTNNSIKNLRLVTSSENKKNRSLVATNKSGCMGVYFNKKIGRWIAEIVCDSKHYPLGSFHDYDSAVAARKKAEIDFNFHQNHGGEKVVIG